jgi:NNP family nitrate/nitrite transporter-like MFS transporter
VLVFRRDDRRGRLACGVGQDQRRHSGALSGGSLAAYVTGFVALFTLSGIGNGSVYNMIPSIFDVKAQSIEDLSQAEKADWSRRMSGALIGIAGAIAVLLGFYVVCTAITWFSYERTPGRAPVRKSVTVAHAAAPT